MQKKIIALAIAAAVSAPAFADNANITFYGTVDASFDMINTGSGNTAANGTTAVNGVNKKVVSSNVSKFGFKGSEDLGGGLAAVWQIEQQIDIDGGTKAGASGTIFATRNTFAGLKSDALGTVLMGKHDTPYKLSTRKFDVFGDNIADNRSMMGGVSGASAAASFDGRQNNALVYISPEVAGLSAAVAYVNLNEDITGAPAAAPTAAQTLAIQNASAVSLGAFYKNHEMIEGVKLDAGLGYESHTLESTIAGGKESATKLGAGVEFGDIYVSGAFESTSDTLGASNTDKYSHTAAYAGVKYSMGSDAVKLAYTKVGDLKSVANSGSSQISLGYDHGLSKRTKLYAIYSAITNGNGINYGFTSGTSTGAGFSSAGFGTSPTVISLGLKHSF